ncbi:MAG: enoyl-CoA hydratase/isomerase family protein [Burkholderiales bacterium]|nr:enoyl-CoA hydratase/isomerase family protein [Burkholderiales bacterium]
MLRSLADAVRRAREEPAVRVALVRSALPKFFCSGADIATLRESDRAQFASFLAVAHEAVDLIARTPKLFIAAIAGHCIGGGLEIALACDFRWASAGKYRLGLAEANLGLAPGMGGTQRLPRLIPKSRALHMMVTGEMLRTGRGAAGRHRRPGLSGGNVLGRSDRRGAQARGRAEHGAGLHQALGQRRPGDQPGRGAGARARASEHAVRLGRRRRGREGVPRKAAGEVLRQVTRAGAPNGKRVQVQ